MKGGGSVSGSQTTDVSHFHFGPALAASEDKEPAQNATIPIASLFLRLFALRMTINGLEQLNDAAWNMLLDLYVNQEHGRGNSVSSLGVGSGVPQTTALRQIRVMEELGVIRVETDPLDRRRRRVHLSAMTKSSLDGYLTMAAERIDKQVLGS